MERIYTDLVATANERSARHIQEAHILCDLPPTIEFYGFHIAIHFHVPLCGAHILTKRDDVDVNLTKFCWPFSRNWPGGMVINEESADL
jgi:hypothetical protein